MKRGPFHLKAAIAGLTLLTLTLLLVSTAGSRVQSDPTQPPLLLPIIRNATPPTRTPTALPGAPTATATSPANPGGTPTTTATSGPLPTGLRIVFVSRQIPSEGSIYYETTKSMPGVGPHSRFRTAAPGRLLVREDDGSITILIDGAKPSPASLNLIDVNAPDVSYNGQTIVFAGLPQGSYEDAPTRNADAWRIYAINADGSNLRQITFSDQNLNMSQFGDAGPSLEGYDDGDPVWLPDGRIVFSSTRWPAYSHYSGARATNLYVVNADGSNLHRITAERNGADRPLIDPLTGKIVYARWWRNHRFPLNSLATITDPRGGFIQNLGLTTDRTSTEPNAEVMFRNAWQASSINPDGTGLAMWTGRFRNEEGNHVYGGAFTPSGDLIANFFPMYNMTEASGFGGLRRYTRGPNPYTSIIGITGLSLDYARPDNPNTPQDETSYGVFNGSYAAEPEVLADGRLLFSLAEDVNQDYGLYIANIDGSSSSKLYDQVGTAELRARVIRQRPLPPIIADQVTQVPSLLPPDADGPYDSDGTFIFDDLNVFFNAPVDSDIVSAPGIGTVDTIRFFADHQRTSSGSFPSLDWPILLAELEVAADGSVRNDAAPANIPLFEQLRGNGQVPITRGLPTQANGSAHVAGMNFGRPGEHARCVGCHAGHSLIPVPSPQEARWTNLAPGAQLSASSSRDASQIGGLTDRRVMKGEIWRYWNSASEQTSGQWVQLTFAQPIAIRTVRLYNPRTGGEANSSIQVGEATVKLYSDAAGTVEVARASSGQLSVMGTDVGFAEVTARVVRIEIDSVSGTFYGIPLAALAEVEVIGKGVAE
jgi:hypothetical protein